MRARVALSARMPFDHRYSAHPLGLVVGRLATLADNVVALSPLDLLQELRGFVAGLPLAGTLHEQLLARSLVTHLLGRLAHQTHYDLFPELTAGFLALVASPWTGDEWFRAFTQLADCFEAVFRNHNDLGPGHPSIDVRLDMAERFIETHYTDPKISLHRVARHVGLSPGHLARMLKRHTGSGFIDHLRRCRITAAQKLLEGTALTIKEIAARVGYGTPRQLERDFKRLSGVTPHAFRQAPSHGLSGPPRTSISA